MLPPGLGRQFLASFGVGVREEVSKSTALVAILWIGLHLPVPFSSREGMIYGAMSGLAFAAVENLETFHKMAHLDQLTAAHGIDATMAWTVAAALSRLVLTPLAHACWSATVGFGFTAPGRSQVKRLALGVGAFALVSVVHGLYDTCATLGNRLGVGALLALSFVLLLFLVSRGEQFEGHVPERRHDRTLVVPAPLGVKKLALPVALAALVLALVGWSLAHYGLTAGV
jgi:RsiW-degrading membrane proteinase PrsW (M82 family)